MSKKCIPEIEKRPANKITMEMTHDELEQLLNAELDKPADEMDADLIEEILAVMRTDEPTPEQRQAALAVAKQHLPRRAKKHLPQTVLRFAAAAAAILVIMVLGLRDAGAFRWTLITKLLQPVAQTFGIVIDDQTITPQETPMPQYAVADAPSTTVAYAALDEVPEMHEGYVIRPRWLPEGFEFASGSLFSSFDSEIYSLDFAKGEAWFNFRVYIITQDSTVYSHEFERNLDEPIERVIGQHTVTFYTNADDDTQSAFWIHENAHYRLVGDLTLDHVTQFIESLD